MNPPRCADLRRIIRSFISSPVVSLLWVLFAVTLGVLFVVMPRYVDDLWYAEHIADWIEGRRTGLPMGEMIETWTQHYLTDNARLANVLIVPFLLLPKWVGSGLAAAALSYALIKGNVMADARMRALPAGVIMVLAAYCLPWYDSMGSEDLQFNYAIPTWMGVLAITFFLSARHTGSWQNFLTLVVGVIFGAWHEGISVPVLGAFLLILMFCPRYRTVGNVMLTLGTALGFCYLLSCPVFFSRAGEVGSIFAPSRILMIAFSHSAFLLASCISAIMLLSRRGREVLSDPWTMILLLSAILSVGVHIMATRTPRTGWWGEFASILLLGTLAARTKCSSRFGSIVGTLLIILAFVHQILADYYAFSIRSDFDRATAWYSTATRGEMFLDFDTEHDPPLAVWFAPDFTLFAGKSNRELVKNYYHRDDSLEFSVIPAQLRLATESAGKPVNGNAGVRELGGRLFMPLNDSIAKIISERDPEKDHTESAASLTSGEFAASIDYGVIAKPAQRVFYIPFTSPSDGRRYLWLYPWRAIIEHRIGHPVAFSIPD